MGNSATKELAAHAKPYFLIERILTPEIRVGVVRGSEQTQGICLGDYTIHQRLGTGQIRRLKRFEQGQDEITYIFDHETKLWMYKCGDEPPGVASSDEPRWFDVCYELKSPGFSRSGAIPYSVTRKFKPISMGDATKEIDAMGDLFAGKN